MVGSSKLCSSDDRQRHFKKRRIKKNSPKEQKNFVELTKYENLISEEIKIFQKTFDEYCLERLITDNANHYLEREKNDPSRGEEGKG